MLSVFRVCSLLAAKPDGCTDERRYERKSFGKGRKLFLGAGHLLLIRTKLVLTALQNWKDH
jgi:hypothetical protein